MNSRIKSILLSLLIIIILVPILINLLIIKPAERKRQEELEQKKLEQEEIKDTSLEETEIENLEIELSVQDKIKYLKEKKNSLYTYELDNLWNFYFKDLGDNLWLYNWEKKLWEYNKSDSVDLKEIIWINDYIYFQIWENKYLYNLNTNKSISLDINLGIEYIKNWNKTWKFLFKTEVWIFVYDLNKNSFEYFNFFEDFVYVEDWYLWIINNDDELRLKNLSLQNNSKNLIYYYNPTTKEKKIIFKTDKKLEKIYILNWTIYFEDSEWKVYTLENY